MLPVGSRDHGTAHTHGPQRAVRRHCGNALIAAGKNNLIRTEGSKNDAVSHCHIHAGLAHDQLSRSGLGVLLFPGKKRRDLTAEHGIGNQAQHQHQAHSHRNAAHLRLGPAAACPPTASFDGLVAVQLLILLTEGARFICFGEHLSAFRTFQKAHCISPHLNSLHSIIRFSISASTEKQGNSSFFYIVPCF